ncbi:MAG: biotin--[acetyl-CoA-carboxylase] ligase [Hyperthermus sp.]|nr:MAG: biotin--[acetyl-CoA-carboxylase] ligase [Hyperthermus sp.]
MLDYSRRNTIIPPLRYFEIFDQTSSTMNHKPLHVPGAIAALRQTSGRGRRGRKWHSDYGGAWLTLFLPKSAIAATGPRISLAIGGCLARSLEEHVKSPLGVKWPNDIYTEVGKLAGILIEKSGEVLAIGVGVNVYNKPPSMGANLASQGYSGKIAEIYTIIINSIYEAVYSTDQCLQEAMKRDILKGREVIIDTGEGSLKGVALGIGTLGQLIVKGQDKIYEVYCCSVKAVINGKCSGRRDSTITAH